MDEYDRRAKALTRRAAAKYGQTATLPGGDPTRDVIDYLMNELAGVERYTAMIKERIKPLGNVLYATRMEQLHRRLDWLTADARRYFSHLELIRKQCIAAGINLGAPEDLS